jgi:hypothetical protein
VLADGDCSRRAGRWRQLDEELDEELEQAQVEKKVARDAIGRMRRRLLRHGLPPRWLSRAAASAASLSTKLDSNSETVDGSVTARAVDFRIFKINNLAGQPVGPCRPLSYSFDYNCQTGAHDRPQTLGFLRRRPSAFATGGQPVTPFSTKRPGLTIIFARSRFDSARASDAGAGRSFAINQRSSYCRACGSSGCHSRRLPP